MFKQCDPSDAGIVTNTLMIAAATAGRVTQPCMACEVTAATKGKDKEWWCECRQEKYGQIVLPNLAPNADGMVSEELCASASVMANALGASAIFVYTRRGYMANFLSRCRSPDCPIFAFTGTSTYSLFLFSCFISSKFVFRQNFCAFRKIRVL